MNKKFLISGGISAVIIAIIIIAFSSSPSPPKINYDFQIASYDDLNQNLKKILSSENISMSSPLKLTDSSVEKYCSFFSDAEKQQKIQYCTSTELKSIDGKFLGNVHIVGSENEPMAVLVIIQSDPFYTNYAQIQTVFDKVIQTTVCDCWPSESPGGFSSISEWIDAAKIHHMEAKKTTSKSQVTGLRGSDITLEITTNMDGYLWKLILEEN